MENNTNNDVQMIINEENTELHENNFPVTHMLKVIGGKWKILLIAAIRDDCPARFGELRRKMEDVTQTMLTTQLRELERDGIICRKAYAESPPRVEYKLTELGKTLIPVIRVMEEWWDLYCLNKHISLFEDKDFASL